ncbi:MAG TPA: ABC transporter permease [Acidimicrobiia bacterium]|jgi:osmoprotectant transport system permease protein
MGFFGQVFDFLTSSDQWHGDESIPHLLGQHVQLTVVSVLVAAVVALPIGIVLGHVRTGGAIAVNIANIGRALPAFALLILSVQWVGIGDPTGILTPVQSVPAFIAMFALAVPPMLANAYVGMANVDDEIRESARGMGMNARQMIWRVELPNAVPLVMAGVRTATVAVVATATLAALVDSGGFGRYIIDGIAVNDHAKIFAGGLLVALLAIAMELLLALLQRAITSPGIRAEGKIRVRDLATQPIVSATGPAL